MFATIGEWSIRKTLFLGGLLAIGFGLTSEPALSQGEDDDQDVEEITVTGSRIQRGNLTQPNPVYGLSAEEIKATGQLSIIDVIDDLPQLFASQNSAQSGFFDTSTDTGRDNTPGLALLDLRALGPNRTLVLVDGRRHVSGQAGSGGVDVGSIPASLIDRVEVLTGGASSVYGADAVTGVVNFIMKDNFEGTEIDVHGGVPSDNGGEEWQVSLTHGMNLADNRLNITLNATARVREEVKYRDRDWAIDSAIAEVQEQNWRLIFQNIDSIPAGAGLGDSITTTDASGNCVAAFAGTDPSLVTRACTARPQSIEGNMRFGLTSPGGLFAFALADDITAANPTRAIAFPLFHTAADLGDLAPGTPLMDYNNNGVDDCFESDVGDRSVGGCVVIEPDGTVRPFNPGLIDGDFLNFDSIGSDGSPQSGADHESLDPKFEQYVLNLLIDFEVSDSTSLFADLKYVQSDTTDIGGTIFFDDTSNLSLQNPFVPAELANLMNSILALNPQFANTAQYFMTRDPEDIQNDAIYERETFRIVAGIEGKFWDSWSWEGTINYGRTTEDTKNRSLLIDRYYASLDAVTDASGNPVCRSEVDPNWTLDDFNTGSIWGIPGVNTFTPGDGSCAPGNPFGENNWSQAAQDFFAPYRIQNDEIKQTVASLIVVGDTERWFSLPGGPIGLAGGIEYRKEESESIPDAFDQAGYYHPFDTPTAPISGDFSVSEIFVEISAPLIADATFARELTIDAAYRLSEYDLTVGTTNSYSAGISWAPVDDLRFRGTFSRAVRAPNIFELFSPVSGATFNLTTDICDQGLIDSLLMSDPATGMQRQANCAADPLVGPGFQNPLTSFFTGQAGGNPDLMEESSDTLTIGAVITPRFAEGLTITVDYWEIEIDDAIQQVSGLDILRGCYDGPTLDPFFCSQFTRISDPTSGFFGGLNFLRTGQVNFAGLEASGIDTEIVYEFDLLNGGVNLRANVTYLDELLEFRSAFAPTVADDDKGEMQRPEWAGNFSARWSGDRLSFGYAAKYTGNQLHRNVPVNEASSFDNGVAGVKWVHDLSANYEISDRYTVYGGVQNFTDEQPYATQPSFPTGLRGRYFFAGVTATL